MRAINIIVLLVFSLLLITACSSKLESTEDLRSFVMDQGNGLTKEKTFGELKVRLTHRPTDLLVDQELGSAEPTATMVDSLRKQYDDYLYFLLTFSANGNEIESWRLTDQQEFGMRVQTLAFGMAERVKLSSDSRDSIPLVDFLYQRTFGVGSGSDVLFAFDRKDLGDAEWLNFKLDDIGLGIGTNYFRFDASAIKSAPQLPFIQ